MNRKTNKTRTAAYHVSLPIRLVEEFDELLSFKASRSKAIAYLMRNHVDDAGIPINMMETQQILAAAMARYPPHSFEWITLKAMIDSIFQMRDEQSS